MFNEYFGAEMEKMFFEDISNSKEVDIDVWNKRPFPAKIIEWFNHCFRDHL